MRQFLIILFLITSAFAQKSDVGIVIDKMVTASGGEEKLLQLNNYKQTWNVEFMNSDKSGFDKRTVILPEYFKTEIIYPNRKEIRVVDKESGTKIFGDKTLQAKGPMLDAMRLQLMRLYHPLELKKRVKDLTMTQNNKQYILALKNGSIAVEYIVSKKTYLIEKVIGRLQMGPQQMEFLTRYEDYKTENGVLIPHKEVKFVGSMNTAIMTLKEIEFTK